MKEKVDINENLFACSDNENEENNIELAKINNNTEGIKSDYDENIKIDVNEDIIIGEN